MTLTPCIREAYDYAPELPYFVVGKDSENTLVCLSQVATMKHAMKIADMYRRSPKYAHVVSLIVGKA